MAGRARSEASVCAHHEGLKQSRGLRSVGFPRAGSQALRAAVTPQPQRFSPVRKCRAKNQAGIRKGLQKPAIGQAPKPCAGFLKTPRHDPASVGAECGGKGIRLGKPEPAFFGGPENFDAIFGGTKPFDVGVKVWLRRFESGDWFALYRAQNVLVFFLFRLSSTR